MRESLASTFEAKVATLASGETNSWENINEQYEKFSGLMNQLFEFDSGFYSIITLYIQTFSVFNMKANMLPSISHASASLIGEISSFN